MTLNLFLAGGISDRQLRAITNLVHFCSVMSENIAEFLESEEEFTIDSDIAIVDAWLRVLQSQPVRTEPPEAA